MGWMIPWESQIERDFILLAEVDPTVIAIHAQPFQVEYGFAGGLHHYTPDFLLETIDGTEVHEVKPDEDLADEELQKRLRKVGAVIEQMGHNFLIDAESFIRTEPRLSNAAVINRAAKFELPAPALPNIREILESVHTISIGDLAAGRVGRPIPEATVFGLVGQGKLLADLNEPLGPSTMVYVSNNPPGIVTVKARQ
ncbi:conserved protein of unknown function(containing TnsA endonuclease, N-terminal domain,23-94) [Magnetospirillum sp. XM-1]|nr:conserved protein of unknown function(containing TnsA endonuclease, N-terminal domain,23-94) [Magnetospirillum sp. XM-1]